MSNTNFLLTYGFDGICLKQMASKTGKYGRFRPPKMDETFVVTTRWGYTNGLKKDQGAISNLNFGNQKNIGPNLSTMKRCGEKKKLLGTAAANMLDANS